MPAWVVIMAGGGGTRLWPLSRRSKPKQFLPLLPGGETLLAAAVRRCGPIAPIERTVVVTAASQVAEVRRCVPALPEGNVVAEPEGRNTAPCIGLAAQEVEKRDRDAVLAVLPSDQFIRDERSFVRALAQALVLAGKGQVVTIGIRPTRPETGYGYIELGEAAAGASAEAKGAFRVARFTEKPDAQTAAGFVAGGHHLWNGGMFVFRADRIRGEIDKHLPELGKLLEAIRKQPGKLGALYRQAPKISIDYGVMEKLPASGDMTVVEADLGWSDVGSWAALPDVTPLDGAGNAVAGEALAIDARGCVLASDGPLVAVVGVSDLVVVATRDAVLVVPKDRAQDVKKIVEALEAQRRDTHL
jgi:mannose-1-phosphate guanylyltransferase